MVTIPKKFADVPDCPKDEMKDFTDITNWPLNVNDPLTGAQKTVATASISQDFENYPGKIPFEMCKKRIDGKDHYFLSNTSLELFRNYYPACLKSVAPFCNQPSVPTSPLAGLFNDDDELTGEFKIPTEIMHKLGISDETVEKYKNPPYKPAVTNDTQLFEDHYRIIGTPLNEDFVAQVQSLVPEYALGIFRSDGINVYAHKDVRTLSIIHTKLIGVRNIMSASPTRNKQQVARLDRIIRRFKEIKEEAEADEREAAAKARDSSSHLYTLLIFGIACPTLSIAGGVLVHKFLGKAASAPLMLAGVLGNVVLNMQRQDREQMLNEML